MYATHFCLPPIMAYTVLPPSSGPKGSRFNMVTKSPAHPPKAAGCSNMSISGAGETGMTSAASPLMSKGSASVIPELSPMRIQVD